MERNGEMSKAIIYTDWREKAVFSPTGLAPQVLLENEKLKALIGALEAGQRIPPHPEALGMYHFLEGSGWMTVDGERLAVSAGTTVFVPQGVERGIEAETRLAFLAARIS
jgi:quercetin dioxygenase-like cupin family protein